MLNFDFLKLISDYHCGSDLGWSDLLFFTAPKDDPKWAPRLAVFGDMGNENPQSLPRLQEETQRGLYDAILHVGDFAYDMYMVIYIRSLIYFINLFNTFIYFYYYL